MNNRLDESISAFGLVIAYKFVKALSTPFEEWDAFKVGLIDKNGKKLKKASTQEEKDALPLWKVLIRNLKVILGKLPFGKTKLASFVTALALLKENKEYFGLGQIKDFDSLQEYLLARDEIKELLISSEETTKDDLVSIEEGELAYFTFCDLLNDIDGVASPVFCVLRESNDKKYLVRDIISGINYELPNEALIGAKNEKQ